jgi:hypothetical protein
VKRAALILALSLGVLPAAAQTPAADPIDALLRGPGTDPEEPDTAAEGTTLAAPDPELPAAPRPYVPAPRLSAPVRIEETGKSPDAPPGPNELAYESRVRASMASAQGFQGPLDGGWTLAGPAGELYALQLVDRAGALQGAWRDLRKPGALDASGFIDQAERVGSDVTLRFGPMVAVLQSSADGRWSGELTEGGRTQAVSLRRRTP